MFVYSTALQELLDAILLHNLYYKNCSDCSVSQSVSQSVRPSADISALKEISRNLGNH